MNTTVATSCGFFKTLFGLHAQTPFNPALARSRPKAIALGGPHGDLDRAHREHYQSDDAKDSVHGKTKCGKCLGFPALWFRS